jgi:hypothetical protein
MLEVLSQPRLGNWMQTVSGRQFWPLDPHVDDIDINDIAHALAMQPRYGGHCRQFYSVAEHSYLVSKEVEMRYGTAPARAALLHDASEAYLVDIPRPIKAHLSNYKQLETALCECIARKYGVPYPWPKEVLEIDERILLDERERLLTKSPAPPGDGWPDHLEPTGAVILGLFPDRAKMLFLARFNELFA